MTAEVIDARLTEMIRVMGGSTDSLDRTKAAINRANHIACWIRKDTSPELAAELVSEARVLLNQAIATLMAVRDNIQRAEANIAEIRR